MSDSAWAPLRTPAFRTLWIGGILVNFAVWMQNLGAAWLMTVLDGSPSMVALVQTATALPAFLFGLPGGVLADLVDRRLWLMITQGLMLGTALLLCASAAVWGISPWPLLLLTFLLGIGNALNMSAWMATSVSVIPREHTAAASGLSGISYNLARVFGPAAAGLLLAALGATGLFAIVATCFAIVLAMLLKLTGIAAVRTLPSERPLPAMLAGLRYVRDARPVRQALWRTLACVAPASALWGLLPLVARDGLHLGANGYGLLFGCLGIGGVVGASLRPQMQRRLTVDGTITTGTFVFGAVTAASGIVHQPAALAALLLIGGFSWMIANSTLVAVVQTSAAGWVRARVASVYLLVMMGGMAIGSAFWGLLANHLGVNVALEIAGLVTALGAFAGYGRRLHLGTDGDFAPAVSAMAAWPHPMSPPLAGPITVRIVYIAAVDRTATFAAALREVGLARRRNGAKQWRVEVDEGTRFTEHYTLDSWLDYLRHAERTTHGERRAEEQLLAMTEDGHCELQYLHMPPSAAEPQPLMAARRAAQ